MKTASATKATRSKASAAPTITRSTGVDTVPVRSALAQMTIRAERHAKATNSPEAWEHAINCATEFMALVQETLGDVPKITRTR